MSFSFPQNHIPDNPRNGGERTSQTTHSAKLIDENSNLRTELEKLNKQVFQLTRQVGERDEQIAQLSSLLEVSQRQRMADSQKQEEEVRRLHSFLKQSQGLIERMKLKLVNLGVDPLTLSELEMAPDVQAQIDQRKEEFKMRVEQLRSSVAKHKEELKTKEQECASFLENVNAAVQRSRETGSLSTTPLRLTRPVLPTTSRPTPSEMERRVHSILQRICRSPVLVAGSPAPQPLQLETDRQPDQTSVAEEDFLFSPKGPSLPPSSPNSPPAESVGMDLVTTPHKAQETRTVPLTVFGVERSLPSSPGRDQQGHSLKQENESLASQDEQFFEANGLE